MQEAVHPTEVDKNTEVRDVLDRTFHLVSNLHRLEEPLTLLRTLGFDHFPAAQHHVLPLVVDLHDLELVHVPDVLVQILRRNNVDLAARQERLDTHIDSQAALHHALHLPLHKTTVLEDLHDLVPVLLVRRLLLRQDHHALVVLKALKEDFHLVAHFNLIILKFADGNRPFGLVPDVHKDHLRFDV